MAAGRLSRSALAVAIGLVAVPSTVGCGDQGDSASSEDAERQVERFGDARSRGIAAAIERGELPPIARELIEPDGSITQNFVEGPNFNEDLVRTQDGGQSGPKLRWDLDRNGRIDRDEREITEADLYAATAGLR